MEKYYIGVAIFIVVIIVFRLLLSRPSKLKEEHDQRMREIKEKYKGRYDEVKPLPKDKKKWS
ncbi:hypothetical protein JXQ70_20385 [bacterium]|nr:hypothetical protein [bacterium]